MNGIGLGPALVVIALAVITLAAISTGLVWLVMRRRGCGWLPGYIVTRSRRRPPELGKPCHLLLCVADHYEPKAGGASIEQGRRRVERWLHEYPRQFARFRDSDGRTPRHSFFFPIEEYEPAYLDALAELCRAGFGEVEIHLHHDRDTSENLRQSLVAFRDMLASRHGLLSRDRQTGELRYGFIHGNWALCNSRPDGDWCGVNDELKVLTETGCYADFTFPSFPDATQPPIINRLYYAQDIPGRPRSHFTPVSPLEQGRQGVLLLVSGPLLLDWRRRKWGLVPRVENGCLQATQPPSMARLDNWLRACIRVEGRPDWFFVKLHAHGAPEEAHQTLLGEPMVRFHEALAQRAARDPNFHFHYVTAREMVNLVKAAEEGHRGSVAEAIDYSVISNLVRADALSQASKQRE